LLTWLLTQLVSESAGDRFCLVSEYLLPMRMSSKRAPLWLQTESIEVCSLFRSFGMEAVWLSDREIVERKNHNIISR
jgi:hypothetical protein